MPRKTLRARGLRSLCRRDVDWSLSSVPVDTDERRALLTRDLPIARPHHHAANGLPDGVPARRVPSREFRIGRFSIGSDGKYGLRTAAK